ncbi:MAG: GNAT family N-acetyltransferase [Ardenticatenaceae bacterium]|nr:GNAT family N-acetyltransferase [Ardenticatenaceae bacterium]
MSSARQAIRHLLNERSPLDGIADYFAFHYPEERTQIMTYPIDAALATGYVALSRTGIDLFRPFVTLRLPPDDMTGSLELLYKAIAPETAVILNMLPTDAPLLTALLDVQAEENINILVLDEDQFEPIINVLVTESASNNQYPRFIIRSQDEIAASAGINWQNNFFAEITVTTNPRHRRQGFGRSVVAAAVNHVLANGRLPLYAVADNNEASLQLAQRLGFRDKGYRHVLLQGLFKPRF